MIQRRFRYLPVFLLLSNLPSVSVIEAAEARRRASPLPLAATPSNWRKSSG